MYSIGINTFLFASPFRKADLHWIGQFARWGFDTLELVVDDPASMDAARFLGALRDAVLPCHVVCAVFGPDRDLRGTPQQQAAARHYLLATLDWAAEVGANLVVGPAYSSVGHTAFYSPAQSAQQRATVIRHLRELSAYAGRKGLQMAIEPLNRFETDFINTCEQGLKLIEEVGSEHLRLHLDTFHMNIEEKSLPAAIRRAGPALAHLHVCGNDRGTPGNDHTDWQGIAAALRDTQYKGELVIESFTPAVQSIARSASIWRQIEPSPEEIARKGLAFLRRFSSQPVR